MNYTDDPVRDADQHWDDRQRKADAYDKELSMCIEMINGDIAANEWGVILEVEEELVDSDAISQVVRLRESQGKEAAWEAMDEAIDKAIERVAARRVKE
jgi:hypothetical protein